MPAISATITKLVPSDASVSWTAQIKHSRGGFCGGKTEFNSTIVKGNGSSFSPVWNNFWGGELEVIATCSAPGYISAQGSDNSRKVIGVEPTNNLKGGYLNLSKTPFEVEDMRRIACHESAFKQFKSNGLPVYGAGGDAGLMQICYAQQANHLWNWKNNVDYAEQILTVDSLNGAKNYLNNEVNSNNADQYTLEQLRLEAIHRYNAGCCQGSANRYWAWNGEQWIEDPTGGANGYVDNVLAKGAACTN